MFRVLLVTLVLFSAISAQQMQGVFVSDMDTNTKACDNFFDYSNGKWRKENPIPASMQRWSRRWEAGELAKDRVRLILDEVAAGGQKDNYRKGSVDQIVSDFYVACTDEAMAEKNGYAAIQPILKQIDAAKNKADLERAMADLSLMSVGGPFRLFGGQDVHVPENVIARINAGGIGLPDRAYYLKPDQRFADAREKYKAHVAKMFTLVGYDSEKAAAAATVIFDMEMALAKPMFDNVQRRDPKNSDNKMSFADLQKMAPNLDWAAFYKKLGVKPGELNVAQPAHLKEFSTMLAARSIADWQTYLKWRVINDTAEYLSKDFVEANFAFNNAYLFGEKQMKPRNMRCAETADGMLSDAVGKKYVEKYFPPAAKARMLELVNNELLAMKEIIGELEWMSPETKKQALEKLATFRVKVGYPDKWRDYSNVKISRASHAENVMAASQFLAAENLASIGKPVDRGRWGMTAATSNAQYSAVLNDITFPAGILQPPAFSLDYSDPINYGAIGVVIGHEISHGFDDQGSKFDSTGRLRNWWTDEDLKKFQVRTDCVAKQFDGYAIEPGLFHVGRLGLGESIADLAGAKIAYRALQIAQRKKPMPTIDGFTPEQQFFIAWGQFRGDETRPETQRQMIQTGPHPVAKYRVIGPLSNLLDFQKTFGCSADSAMVRPANVRCDVW